MAKRNNDSKAVKQKAPDADAMQRMDEALKAAMKMPPRKHKDEKKGQRKGAPKKRQAGRL